MFLTLNHICPNTFGIRAIYLDMNECDRRELWKELRQMVNKVSEDVNILYESHNVVLEKVKALVEFNKVMNEELLRLQEGLENIMEEELQSLDSMKLEEQIKFQANYPSVKTNGIITGDTSPSAATRRVSAVPP